jgi:hypothetical protein
MHADLFQPQYYDLHVSLVPKSGGLVPARVPGTTKISDFKYGPLERACAARRLIICQFREMIPRAPDA